MHDSFTLFTILRRKLRVAAVVLLAAPAAGAATYHVNPATGSMSNAGTASQPWSTLEAVFAANKTFASGDEILLYTGYHGAPIVKGNNSGTVRIRPATGATRVPSIWRGISQAPSSSIWPRWRTPAPACR